MGTRRVGDNLAQAGLEEGHDDNTSLRKLTLKYLTDKEIHGKIDS